LPHLESDTVNSPLNMRGNNNQQNRFGEDNNIYENQHAFNQE
jgi:hypothetical protein